MEITAWRREHRGPFRSHQLNDGDGYEPALALFDREVAFEQILRQQVDWQWSEVAAGPGAERDLMVRAAPTFPSRAG